MLRFNALIAFCANIIIICHDRNVYRFIRVCRCFLVRACRPNERRRRRRAHALGFRKAAGGGAKCASSGVPRHTATSTRRARGLVRKLDGSSRASPSSRHGEEEAPVQSRRQRVEAKVFPRRWRRERSQPERCDGEERVRDCQPSTKIRHSRSQGEGRAR